MQRDPRLAGQGAILLCAMLWSTSGLFIKLIDWHPVLISGSRSILAAAVLLSLRHFSVRKKKAVPLGLKDAPPLAASGIFYAATMMLFVNANKLTASANAILLQYAAPVWAALLAWFFLKEKPRWENWASIAMVMLGMFLVFSGGLEAGSLAGNMLAVVSGISFGASSVAMRAHKDRSPADIFIFSHLICAAFSLPFFFLHPPPLSAHNLACIAYMGILQIGAASALFAYGIKRVPAVQAMLTAAIEPVLNPVWVLLATGEKPSASALAGGGIIVAAVIFSSTLSSLRRRS